MSNAGGSRGAHNGSRGKQGRRVLNRSVAAIVVACQLHSGALCDPCSSPFLSQRCTGAKQFKFRRRRLAKLSSTLRQADYSVRSNPDNGLKLFRH